MLLILSLTNQAIMATGFRELTAYKEAFTLAMEIFELTKSFPQSEKYSFTYQLRRSSRSVCRAIGEEYHKRQYPKHFSSRISDGDMENMETQDSLDFAKACKSLEDSQHSALISNSEGVGRLLNHMINEPERYKPKGN
jgi:four helix bundle protein